ncbi:MAG TPA: DUF4340 domain-containing protein [Candidatus Paceibacterota bacterium]|nr:DUF4340 domain-containing protein [Verrucomicrobiota bacterium]HSA10308.1 DUF4340 domain-containing protein [Candidatus Paceibacterota bacterium]
MNRKQLFILLALVVVLGVLGLVVHQRNQSAWQGAGRKGSAGKLLGELPVNDVASIMIKGGTNQLDLVRKDNLWRVKQRNDYPANFSEISGLLLKAADLKAAQSEEIGPSHLGRYKLLPPGPGTNTAVLVELRDEAGKVIRSLLLGKTHMRKSEGRPSPMGEMGESEGWPDGRYVMVGTSAKTVAVVSDPLSNIEAKPEQWLNKDFFKVEKIRSVAVTYPLATNSWKVTRDTENATDWKLADAKADEKLDSSKTSSFSYALSSPSFNDVLPADTKPEEVGLDKPTVITLDTFDNFTYAIKLGQKTNDSLPMTLSVTAQIPQERTPGKDEKPEDKDKLDKEFKDNQKKLQDKLSQEQAYGKRIYLVSNWTVDSLLKERGQLLTEKKEEPKKEEKAAATNDKDAADLMEPPKP